MDGLNRQAPWHLAKGIEALYSKGLVVTLACFLVGLFLELIPFGLAVRIQPGFFYAIGILVIVALLPLRCLYVSIGFYKLRSYRFAGLSLMITLLLLGALTYNLSFIAALFP